VKTLQIVLLVAGAWLGVVAYQVQIDNLGADTTPARAWAIVIGAWFFLVAGIVAWSRRPTNRLGPLMAAAGLGSKEEDSVGRYKTDEQSIEAIQVCLEAGVDISFGSAIRALAGLDSIAQTGEWLNVHHLCFGEDCGSTFFRQIQVVEIERILRAVTATHHATAASNASSSRRPSAPEKWIREGLVGRFSLAGLKYSDTRVIERVARSGGFSGFFQQPVGGPENLVLCYAQHARSGLVMLRHFRLPFRQAGPRS